MQVVLAQLLVDMTDQERQRSRIAQESRQRAAAAAAQIQGAQEPAKTKPLPLSRPCGDNRKVVGSAVSPSMALYPMAASFGLAPRLDTMRGSGDRKSADPPQSDTTFTERSSAGVGNAPELCLRDRPKSEAQSTERDILKSPSRALRRTLRRLGRVRATCLL
jgi:hypothetical protein